MNVTSTAHNDEKSEKPVSLFQFWDSNIPDDVAKLTQGVASVNSTLGYLFFDDESAAEFIVTEFGTDILKLYRSCAIPAMRADLFRYCFLFRCGGVYIDADFPAVGSIEPLVSAGFDGCLYNREKGLTNSMMYFRTSENLLAEKILDTAVYNITNRTSNNVWQVTGPAVLQRIYSDESNRHLFDNIHLMEEEEFAQYFKLAQSLDYKSDDTHWLVARQKGINIFND